MPSCDSAIGNHSSAGNLLRHGIAFPNNNPNAIPSLSPTYESNVPGLYVVGRWVVTLIKQAMNQGYEVVEYILGNKIKPADHPLLEARFQFLPYQLDVDRTLKLFQQRIPMFSEMNALLFRELIIDSNVIGVGQPFRLTIAKARCSRKACRFPQGRLRQVLYRG